MNTIRSLALPLCLLFLVSCSGGGGGGDVLSLPGEGSGPALDISNTVEIESTIKSAISDADSSYISFLKSTSQTSSVGTDTTTAAPATTTGENSVDLAINLNPPTTNTADAEIGKAVTTTSNALSVLCSTGSYSETLDKILNGSTGSAHYTGNREAHKTSADSAVFSENASAEFSDYSFSTPGNSADPTYKPVTIKLTGTYKVDINQEASKGIAGLCAGTDGAKEIDFANSFKETKNGSLSISGSYGGALAYVINTSYKQAYSGKLEDIQLAKLEHTVSGTATFKSGDKTIDCTISGTNGYVVKCK